MPPSTRTPNPSPSNRRIRAGNLSPTIFEPFGSVIQNPDTHSGSPKLEKTLANQGSATKWLDVTRMRNWYGLAQSKRAARCVMNMFVCRPRELRPVEGESGGVFDVRILERHPFTAQTFVPLGLGRHEREAYYLVIVAPTLPSGRRGEAERQPPYPTPPTQSKRSLKDRLLGARPSPYTNDYTSTTTPPSATDADELRPKGAGSPDMNGLQAFIARGDQAVTYGPGTWHAPMVVLGERPIDFVVVQYANGVGDEDCQECDVEEGEASVVVAEDIVHQSSRAKL